MPRRITAVPDVFGESPAQEINTETEVLSVVNEVENPQVEAPKVPEAYNHLGKMKTNLPISQKVLYKSLSRLAPYLVQNLVYISQSPLASMRDRTQATKILIDKVLPNLNADHIKLESDNLQSLVIVKAPIKK